MNPNETDSERLSRLLFQARDMIDTRINIVELSTAQPDTYGRAVRDEIDAYRIRRGWNRYGYGHEDERMT